MRDDLDIPMPAMSPGGAPAASYRVPRARPATDPNTRKLAIIAGGIGISLLVIVGGWSLMSGKRSGVPVVEADPRPVRAKPTDAGGMQVAGQDSAIMSGKTEGQAQMTAPAEAPAPEALKPQAATTATATPAPPAPATAAAVTPAAPVATPSAPPAVAPAKPAAAPATAAAKPATPPTPPAAAAKPATPAAPTPSMLAAARTAHPAAPAAAPATAAPAAVPAKGAAAIQLAAVPTEAAAQAEWARLQKRMPELLGSHKPLISKTERDGKTFWRLRTTGFADANAAKSFCEQVKAKQGNCAALTL